MQKNKNLQIEGLRAFAIISVVLFHVFCRYLQIYMNQSIWWMENLGSIAVNLFFLISGYFSCTKTNLFKKLLRLWPGLFLSVLFSSVLLSLLPLPNKSLSFLQIITNAFSINALFNIPYVDGAHWYIHTLIILLFWAALLKKRQTTVWFLFFIICNIILILDIKIIPHFLGNTYINCFLSGCMLMKWDKTRDKLALFTIVLSVFFIFITQGLLLGFAFACTTILFIYAQKQKLTVLKRPFLLFIGKISYELYLIHQILSYVIIYYTSKILNLLFSQIIAILVSFISAIMLWYFCDKIVSPQITRIYNKL